MSTVAVLCSCLSSVAGGKFAASVMDVLLSVCVSIVDSVTAVVGLSTFD